MLGIQDNTESSPDLIAVEESLILVVDVQERLLPAMAEAEKVQKYVKILTDAAALMNVPVIATEQYPKGLGPTVSDALDTSSIQACIEKSGFSVLSEPAVMQAIKDSGKKRIIVCGIEAHVCVNQSVLDLLSNFDGWVYVVEDAVSSRDLQNKATGLERMRKAGAHVVCTEMVVFEWLKKAGTPEFKAISKMIK